MNNLALQSIKKIQEAARKRVAEYGKIVVKNKTKDEIEKLIYDLIDNEAYKLTKKLSSELMAKTTETFKELNSEISKTNNEARLNVLLPPNCRYYADFPLGGMVVLEYEPQYRTVITNNGQNHHPSVHTRKLPFPYMYFIGSYLKENKKYRTLIRGVGCRTAPIKSIDDILFSVPIPHTDGPQYLCQPSTKEVFNDLTSLVDDIINNFWGSRFIYQFNGFTLKNKISSYEQWEKLTPLDMLNVTYHNGKSLKTLVEYSENQASYWHRAPKINANRANSILQNAIRDTLDPNEIIRMVEKVVQSALQQS